MLSAEMLGIRVEAEERLAEILADLEQVRADRLRHLAQGGDGDVSKGSPEAAEVSAGESVYVSGQGSAIPPTEDASESATGLLDRFGRPLYRTVSPQINPFVPAPARASESEPARTPARPRANTARTRREPAGRNLSEGARKAAAVTARTANPVEVNDINEWVADRIRAGLTVSRQIVETEVLRRRTEANDALPARKRAKDVPAPGKTWIYDRLKDGKRLANGGSLRIVREKSA